MTKSIKSQVEAINDFLLEAITGWEFLYEQRDPCELKVWVAPKHIVEILQIGPNSISIADLSARSMTLMPYGMRTFPRSLTISLADPQCLERLREFLIGCSQAYGPAKRYGV